MKRAFCVFLFFCMMLSACGNFGERIKQPVTFYYVRSQSQYFTNDGVIVSEEREASGHRNDLSYLLAIYLMGPIQEDHRSPLPEGTKLYTVSPGAESTEIRLSDLDDLLSDADYALACACLAKTCFGLTETEEVTIFSGERSLSLTADSMYEFDNIPETTEEAS